MEIHFVTGKGGVGKSVVAASLAQSLSSKGQKTLLAELGDESFFANFFSLPEVGWKATPSGLGFDLALWSGNSCLREYALHLLKVEKLYQLFFENPVSKTLIEVAPGLSELAILGKATSGPPRNVGPRFNYDSLVVDCFSSGHFMALIRAPIGMSEAIRFGPMHEQSRSILSVLRDPKLSKFHFVTLPEELPVQETIELSQDLHQALGQRAQVWVNKWIEFPKQLDASRDRIQKEFSIKKGRQDQSWNQLQEKFEDRLRKLPFLFEIDERKVVQTLATEVGK